MKIKRQSTKYKSKEKNIDIMKNIECMIQVLIALIPRPTLFLKRMCLFPRSIDTGVYFSVFNTRMLDNEHRRYGAQRPQNSKCNAHLDVVVILDNNKSSIDVVCCRELASQTAGPLFCSLQCSAKCE